MYPFEWWMKILKGYVRKRNQLECCIVECYTYEEVVECCNEYLSNIEAIGFSKIVCTRGTYANGKI